MCFGHAPAGDEPRARLVGLDAVAKPAGAPTRAGQPAELRLQRVNVALLRDVVCAVDEWVADRFREVFGQVAMGAAVPAARGASERPDVELVLPGDGRIRAAGKVFRVRVRQELRRIFASGATRPTG